MYNFLLSNSLLFLQIQVANYCRARIHLALTEELNKIEAANSKENIDFDLKKKWERAFTHCFQKVDEESMLVAPETVGSTALVAVVSSSHIIVANCGHSRAVLSRGKQAIPLSFDHKVRFKILSYIILVAVLCTICRANNK